MHVEICSACHPFYTGKQKLVDSGGRVERFQRRLEKASWELAQLPQFDYAVVNERDRLDDAVDQVLAIMTAERCRVGRRPVRL